MYELNDAELDAVNGGGQRGLVNVNISDIADLIDVEFRDSFNFTRNETLKDIANNNNVKVGAIIQALGGKAAIRQALRD